MMMVMMMTIPLTHTTSGTRRIRWANTSTHAVTPFLLEPLYGNQLFRKFQDLGSAEHPFLHSARSAKLCSHVSSSRLIKALTWKYDAARLEFVDRLNSQAVVSPCQDQDPDVKGCRKYVWAGVGAPSSLPGNLNNSSQQMRKVGTDMAYDAIRPALGHCHCFEKQL
eukprot:608837-Rhodomonas_salina.3